jgi:hypothetical protein
MRKVQPTCVVSLIGHISATKIKWKIFYDGITPSSV